MRLFRNCSAKIYIFKNHNMMDLTNSSSGSSKKKKGTQIIMNVSSYFFLNLFTFIQKHLQIIIIKSEPRLSLKKVAFLVKSLQNRGYDTFSHRNATATKLFSHEYIYNIIWITCLNFVGDVRDMNYDAITFILKHRCFMKNWSSQFCWHNENCNLVN